MKNKKGFTLVELLAVIAILAILVLIALPNVMSLFNESKERSFLTETKQIYTVGIQQWISDSQIETKDRIYSRCPLCNGPSLNLTGRTLINYLIKFNKAGKVIWFFVTDGTYQYKYEGEGLEVEDITEVDKITEIDQDDIVHFDDNGIVADNYLNTYSSTKYRSLQDAFNSVSTGQTIKVLKDTTEADEVVLDAEKGMITLDLNGHVITTSSTISNKATLNINNSSTTEGVITGTARQTVINLGTLSINEGTTNHKTTIKNTGAQTSNIAVVNVSSRTASIYPNSYIIATSASTGSSVSNAGTLTITGGNFTAGNIIIQNSGTLNMSGNTLTLINSSGMGIVNNGIANINGGDFHVGTIGVVNQPSSNLYIDNSNVRISGSQHAIMNQGMARISGGTYSGGRNYLITNNGNLLLSGGTFNASRDGIQNSDRGHIDINGTSVKLNANSGMGVFNAGYLDVKNGQISARTTGVSNEKTGTLLVSGSGARIIVSGGNGITNYNKVTISAGTIEGVTIGLSNSSITNNGTTYYGNTTITGGTVTGSLCGILVAKNTTLTIGKNDSSLNTSNPIIQSIGINNTYGLNVASGGKVYFYDGSIKSASGTGFSLTGSVTVQSGCTIKKELSSGIERAYLKR